MTIATTDEAEGGDVAFAEDADEQRREDERGDETDGRGREDVEGVGRVDVEHLLHVLGAEHAEHHADGAGQRGEHQHPEHDALLHKPAQHLSGGALLDDLVLARAGCRGAGVEVEDAGGGEHEEDAGEDDDRVDAEGCGR